MRRNAQVLLLVFIFSPLAKADLALPDLIAPTSRFLFSKTCPPACESAFSNTSANEIRNCINSASMDEFFKEIATDQKSELHCEFDYLSQFDHYGFNDYKRSCARFQTLDGVHQAARVTYDNMGGDVIRPKIEVIGKQAYAVSKILDDVKAACKIKNDLVEPTREAESLRCFKTPQMTNSYGPLNISRCEVLTATIARGQATLKFAAQTSWNGSNYFSNKYFNEILSSVSNDCTKLNPNSDWRNKFVKDALNQNSTTSFQKRVIEKSKAVSCETLEFLKTVEADPRVLRTENKKFKYRDYRAFLTAAGLARMAYDGEMKKKYGHLKCDLQLDYGVYAKTVTNVAQGAVGFAAVGSMFLPAVVRGVGSVAMSFARGATILKYGRAVQMAVGIALISGVQVANTAVNLMGQCSSGAPEYSRQKICANKQLEDLPTDALLISDFTEGALAQCTVGVIIELAGLGSLGKTVPEFKKISDFTISPKILVRKFKNIFTANKMENLDFLYQSQRNPGKTRVVTVENIVLKDLNTLFESKDIPTALNNVHQTAILELVRDNQELNDLFLAFSSEYKRVRVLTTRDPRAMAVLQERFQSIQEKLRQLIQHPEYKKYLENPEFRDFVKDPKNWFRMTSGDNRLQSDITARVARQFSDAPNSIIDYYDPRVQAKLKESRDSVIQRIQQFNRPDSTLNRSTNLKYDIWLKKGIFELRDGVKVPSMDLIAILRKQSVSSRNLDQIKKDIIANVQGKFKLTMTADEVDAFYDLYHSGNLYSVDTFVAERVRHNLEAADAGFIMIDFENLGARNIQETIAKVATSGNVDEAVARSAEAEATVTKMLEEAKTKIKAYQQSRPGRFSNVIFTGDDGVLAQNSLQSSGVTPLDLKGLMQNTPSGFRASAVSPINTAGSRVDPANFDQLAFKADKLQSELMELLHTRMGLQKDLKVGLFVRPHASLNPDNPLEKSNLSLFYTSSQPIDASVEAELRKIGDELKNKYNIGSYSTLGFK